MIIYILGHRCVKGDLTEELVCNVVSEEQIDATIIRISKDEKIIKFGVSLTPSVVIDGQVKVMGRIPKKDEVLSWLMHKKIPKSKAA